jgi:clan AA aspartic protease (TIGR02281 family)
MFMTEPHEDRYGADRQEAPARKAGAAVWRRLFGNLRSGEAVVVSALFAALMVGGAMMAYNAGTYPSQPHQVAVPMQRAGGVFVVPTKLNGAITLDFAVDSGASEVVIPLGAFMALKLAGTISDADLLESQTYTMADGSKSEQVRFMIRRLDVGGVVVRDVPATVAPRGGKLLGQSFLGAFKSWQIDNSRHVLRLNY